MEFGVAVFGIMMFIIALSDLSKGQKVNWYVKYRNEEEAILRKLERENHGLTHTQQIELAKEKMKQWEKKNPQPS